MSGPSRYLVVRAVTIVTVRVDRAAALSFHWVKTRVDSADPTGYVGVLPF